MIPVTSWRPATKKRMRRGITESTAPASTRALSGFCPPAALSAASAVGQPSHVAGAGESVKILYAALQTSETEKETLSDKVAQLQQRLAHAELAAAQLEQQLQRQQREAATAAAQAAATAAAHAQLLKQQQAGAKRPQPVFVLGSSFFHARPL